VSHSQGSLVDRRWWAVTLVAGMEAPSAPMAPLPSAGAALGARVTAPAQGAAAAPPPTNQVPPPAQNQRPKQPGPQRLRTHGTQSNYRQNGNQQYRQQNHQVRPPPTANVVQNNVVNVSADATAAA
jgi:hypothetical protein